MDVRTRATTLLVNAFAVEADVRAADVDWVVRAVAVAVVAERDAASGGCSGGDAVTVHNTSGGDIGLPTGIVDGAVDGARNPSCSSALIAQRRFSAFLFELVTGPDTSLPTVT